MEYELTKYKCDKMQKDKLKAPENKMQLCKNAT